MDLDDFEEVVRNSGVDLWTLIDAAILVAGRDHGKELKARRDGIVERLYEATTVHRCPNCDSDGGPLRPCGPEVGVREQIRSTGGEEKKSSNGDRREVSPSTPNSPDKEVEREKEEEEDDDEEPEAENGDRMRFDRPVEDENTKILAIKEHLEDPDQSEDYLVTLLQNLADMDITFKGLKLTDIGRNVNGLRRHPSSEVRRLAKQLIRKWKDLVDEWVKLNSHETATSAIITDGDSPQQILAKTGQNGQHVPDFGYSPNPHNGSSSSDKNNLEMEPKAKPIPRREAPAKQSHSTPSSAATQSPAKAKEQKDSLLDPERLASARRRLHENYQEAQNAKKQRTIQVMDIHDIPKPKNSFFARNKGGFQAKHW